MFLLSNSFENTRLTTNILFCYKKWFCFYPHHWCLSDRPFQSGSVRTIRSMSFFHSIPSEITLCHSLHTSSAAQSERASRKDRMFSAMWSKPWAGQREQRWVWTSQGSKVIQFCQVNFCLPMAAFLLFFPAVLQMYWVILQHKLTILFSVKQLSNVFNSDDLKLNLQGSEHQAY